MSEAQGQAVLRGQGPRPRSRPSSPRGRQGGGLAMFTCGRIEALAVVRALGAKQCVYTAPGRSWSRFCDCKYGGDKLDFGGERGNGCPELRTLTLALER